MKRLIYITFSLILTSLIFTSCSKDEEALQSYDGLSLTATNLKSMSLLHQTAYNLMIENELSKTVYFLDTAVTAQLKQNGSHIPSGPQGFIMTEGAYPFFTAFGGFAAQGGSGDFIRFNNNGTATVQINSNTAEAFYTDQTTFPFTQYEGIGHMHMHHTGPYIATPLPDGTILYLITPGGHASVVWQGRSTVYEMLTSAPEYILTAEYKVAGNGKITKNYIQLK